MLGFVVTALLLLGACGAAGAARTTAPTDGPAGEVLVFAAASLTDAFEEIAADLEHQHTDLDVVLNLAGSQRLAAQIVQGAPADVYAPADEAQMAVVADAGLLAGPPEVFARNSLAIVVEDGNPHAITGPADLAAPDLAVVLAHDGVPAGRYAREALGRAGVDVHPVSLESDVRAVIAKVALGEADAGIVYRSDVVGRDDVEGVAVGGTAPGGGDNDEPVAHYPLAMLAGAGNPAGAAAFTAHVLSPAGQAVLADHGFVPPADQ